MFNKKKHILYNMPNNWNIRIPKDWSYEVVDDNFDEQVFYPPDSDLTIRITTFSITKDNQPLSKEEIFEIYQKIQNDMEPMEANLIEMNFENCDTHIYYREYIENDTLVYHMLIWVIADGTMCYYHSFAADKQECLEGAKLAENLQLVENPINITRYFPGWGR